MRRELQYNFTKTLQTKMGGFNPSVSVRCKKEAKIMNLTSIQGKEAKEVKIKYDTLNC